MATPKKGGESFPRRLRWWLILSLIVLLGSLALFVVNVAAGFVYFTQKTAPTWVTVIGVISIFGMVVGFGALFLIFILAVRMRRSDAQTGEEKRI